MVSMYMWHNCGGGLEAGGAKAGGGVAGEKGGVGEEIGAIGLRGVENVGGGGAVWGLVCCYGVGRWGGAEERRSVG